MRQSEAHPATLAGRERRVRANCSANPPGCGGSGALSGAGLKSEQQKALLGVPGPRRRLGVKE